MGKATLTVHQCWKLARKQKTAVNISAKYNDLLIANGHIITKEEEAKQKEQFEKDKVARKKEKEKQNKLDEKQAKANKKS